MRIMDFGWRRISKASTAVSTRHGVLGMSSSLEVKVFYPT